MIPQVIGQITAVYNDRRTNSGQNGPNGITIHVVAKIMDNRASSNVTAVNRTRAGQLCIVNARKRAKRRLLFPATTIKFVYVYIHVSPRASERTSERASEGEEKRGIARFAVPVVCAKGGWYRTEGFRYDPERRAGVCGSLSRARALCVSEERLDQSLPFVKP